MQIRSEQIGTHPAVKQVIIHGFVWISVPMFTFGEEVEDRPTESVLRRVRVP